MAWSLGVGGGAQGTGFLLLREASLHGSCEREALKFIHSGSLEMGDVTESQAHTRGPRTTKEGRGWGAILLVLPTATYSLCCSHWAGTGRDRATEQDISSNSASKPRPRDGFTDSPEFFTVGFAARKLCKGLFHLHANFLRGRGWKRKTTFPRLPCSQNLGSDSSFHKGIPPKDVELGPELRERRVGQAWTATCWHGGWQPAACGAGAAFLVRRPRSLQLLGVVPGNSAKALLFQPFQRSCKPPGS